MESKIYMIAQSLTHCELNREIIQQIPGNIKNITIMNKRSLMIETESKKLVLYIDLGQEEGLVFQNQLLRFCQEKNINGFLYPLELVSGCFYGLLEEKEFFYVTEWISLEKLSYKNQKHLKSIIRLMCNFRRVIPELDTCYFSGLKRNNNLITKIDEMVANLSIFKMLAQFRLNPTHFDKLFLENYQEINEAIIKTSFMLKKSNYLTLFSGLSPQNMILYNYSRGNLRVHDEQAYLLQLKNCRYELPIIDLGALLVKSGRSNQWGKSWFTELIGEYQKYFQISESELQVLLAYLFCPWELYRLISRYYYNRVNWSVTRFIHKFENQLNSEPFRKDLLRQFIS